MGSNLQRQLQLLQRILTWLFCLLQSLLLQSRFHSCNEASTAFRVGPLSGSRF